MFSALKNERLWLLALFYLVNAIFADGLFPIILTLPPFFIVAYNITNIRSKYLIPEEVLWIVIYLFFVIHPCQAIQANGTSFDVDGPTKLVRYLQADMIKAMGIVCLFLTSFTIVLRSLPAGVVEKKRSLGEANGGPSFPVLVLMVLVSVAVVVPLSGGVANFLAPRYLRDLEPASPVALIPIALISVCAWLAAAKFRVSRITKAATIWPLIAILLMLLFTFNPLNTARFFLMGSWLPVVLIVLNGKLRSRVFYAITILGIAFVFPILSITTRVGIQGLFNFSEERETSGIFHLPYMDGFEIIAQAVHYLENHSFAYGAKTAASVLFFVPRAWWPSKPIVGGLDVGRELLAYKLAGTDNLSFFLAGDFYLDFGFIGVFVGGLITAYVFYQFAVKRPVLFLWPKSLRLRLD